MRERGECEGERGYGRGVSGRGDMGGGVRAERDMEKRCTFVHVTCQREPHTHELSIT